MADQEREMGGTVVAAAWAVAARWVFRFLGLISTIILARFLTPQDFGLVAIAVSVLAVFDALSDFNFGAALVKFRDASDDEYDTAWTLNVLRGLVIALILWGGAPLFANVFDEPRLKGVFYILGASMLVQSFVSIRMAEFLKYLSLEKEFIFRTASKLVSVAATIALAIIYRSYWALIVGGLIESFFRLGLSYFMAPYRPRFHIQSYKRLLTFSGGLMLINVLQVLWKRAEQFSLGYFMPARFVGLYKIGQEVGSMPVGELSAPLMRALFPALSYAQNNKAEFDRLIHEASAILTIILLPAGFGFALVAEDVILLAIGEKWLDSVPIVQAFALIQSLSMIIIAPQYGMKAIGRLKVLIWREVFTVLIMTTAVIIGVIYWGIWGVLAARIVTEFMRFGFGLWAVRRYVGFQTRRLVAQTWRSGVAVIVMSISVLIVVSWLPAGNELNDLALRSFTQIGVGAISYVGVLLLLWKWCGNPSGPEAFILDKLNGVFRKLTHRGVAR